MHRSSMTWEEKCVSLFSLYAVAFVTVIVSLAVRILANPHFTTLSGTLLVAANALSTSRTLYAVNQSSATRGSISVYDIDRGHSLLKTMPTVSNVDDVKGVAASTASGKVLSIAGVTAIMLVESLILLILY